MREKAVLIFFLIILLSFIGLTPSSASQNDGGSGGDAGEAYDTAVLIELVTQYSGALGEGYFNSENEIDRDDWYKFTILSSGNVSVFMERQGTTYVSGSLTSTSTTYITKSISSLDESGWVNASLPIAGTFYLKCHCGTSGYVLYNFTMLFTAWTPTDQNDGGSGGDAGEDYDTAVSINLATQYSGTLGWWYFTGENEIDRDDWYVFSLPSSGNVSVFVERQGATYVSGELTSSSTTYITISISSLDESGWVNASLPVAGIYYLKCHSGSSGYVQYTFTMFFKAWTPTDQNDGGSTGDAGEDYDTAVPIDLVTQYSGTLGWWYFTSENEIDRDDWYAFTILSSGNVSVFVERQGTSYITGQLTSSSTTYITESISSLDESGWVNASLPVAGIYYLKCHSGSSGNVKYNLTIFYTVVPSFDQNDGGSGGDAGETFDTSASVELATQYFGTLGEGYFNSEYEVDRDDWYVVNLPSSGNVSVFVERQGSTYISGQLTSASTTYITESISSLDESGWVNASLPVAGTFYFKCHCGSSGYVQYTFTMFFTAWTPTDQNDGGSTGDAGETYDTAVSIDLATQYSGSLGWWYFTSDNEIDRDDWYMFSLPGSANVSVFVERQGSTYVSGQLTSISTTYITESISSLDDSGWLNASLPVAGIYYLKCHSGSSGKVKYNFTVFVYPPIIEINSPLSRTYSTNNIQLNFSISSGTHEVLLNDESLGSLSSGGLLLGLFDGEHNLTLIVTTWQGKQYFKTVFFTIDTTSPEITIINPTNSTYITNSVFLEFNFNEPTNWVGYSLDNNPNITITTPTLLTSLGEGSHSIVVFASDIFGNIAASSKIWFTVDTPPGVTTTSPINITYSTDSIWLNFTVDEPPDWIGYSLNGASNVTISGNTLLDSLSDGPHYIVLFANDSFGSMVTSPTLWFTIDTTPPEITLINPTNSTYTTNSVLLELSINEPTAWISYSLDGAANVTILGDFLLESLGEGSHHIIVFANDSVGNMGVSITIWFTIDTPPTISIISPTNTVYPLQSVWLNFTINEPAPWIGYSLDGDDNVTIPGNVLLDSLTEGPHSIIIFANDTYGSMNKSTVVYFTIDITSPSITIISPTNITFLARKFWLNFTVNEPTSWIGYSLDGVLNETISGNVLLTSLSLGSHYIVIFAADSVGNVGASSIVWFSIIPDTFPPEITVDGITNTTTYSGDLTIIVNIVDDSALSTVVIWGTNGLETISFHSEHNLTLANISVSSWTVSGLFDTTLLSNGQYDLYIQVVDVHDNAVQYYYRITIENQIPSTTTPPTSTFPSSSSPSSTAPFSSIQPIPTTSKTSDTSTSSSSSSPGFLGILLLISFSIIIIKRRS